MYGMFHPSNVESSSSCKSSMLTSHQKQYQLNCSAVLVISDTELLSVIWILGCTLVAIKGLLPTVVTNDNQVGALFSNLPASLAPASLTAGPAVLEAYLLLPLLSTLSGLCTFLLLDSRNGQPPTPFFLAFHFM